MIYKIAHSGHSGFQYVFNIEKCVPYIILIPCQTKILREFQHIQTRRYQGSSKRENLLIYFSHKINFISLKSEEHDLDLLNINWLKP